jgi:hypothetical protein
MSTYFVSVFAISVCVGVLELISYNRNSAAERAALGIIFLYVVLSPLADAAWNFELGDLSADKIIGETEADVEYEAAAEEAFSEGIRRAVADKFSLPRESITVRIYGFEFSKMRCERIFLLLCGRAAFADNKAVEKYVNEMGLGECDVEIEIG